MLTRTKILLNPNPPTEGGAPAPSGASAQGTPPSGTTPPAGSPSPTAPPTEKTTAQKLWGDIPTKPADKPPTAPEPPPISSPTPPPSGTPPTPPPMVGMTPEMLQQLTKSVVDAAKPQPTQTLLTQEEFDKMFNIFRPKEEDLAIILGEDKKAAATHLTAMLHATAKQASTIAAYQIQMEIKKLQESFQPALQMAQERQLEAMKVEFFEKNPDLKGLEPLLLLIRDGFVAKGVSFPDKDSAFKAIADEAKKHLQAFPGLKNGQPPAGSPSGTPPATPPSKMPSLSGGRGQAGAGDAPPAGSTKSTAERIFG